MERLDGILWRIARLHPGWVTPIIWLGYLAIGGYVEAVDDNPQVAAAYFTGFMLLYMSYPLFVLLFTSGRFCSRAPRQLGRAPAAFFTMQILVSAAILAGPDKVSALAEAANAGNVVAWAVFGVPFLSVFVAFAYLLIGAATGLVAAERGAAARLGRKFGTALQFFYLPFCVFFIHRRVRRLASDYENADPVILDLPMERLVMERMTSGHLCLELTERPGWEDFERYAEELLRWLDGRVVERATAVDMHMWKVEIETLPLLLVYEDFPNRVNLESNSHGGDVLLRKLQARLRTAG